MSIGNELEGRSSSVSLSISLATTTAVFIATCTTYWWKKKQSTKHSTSTTTIDTSSATAMPLLVGVVGAGSIGTICGLALARNPNHKVLLVGRKTLVETVRANQGCLRVRDKSRGKNGGSIMEEIFSASTVNSSSSDSATNAVSSATRTTNSNTLPGISGQVTVTDDFQNLRTFQCSIVIVATKTTATEEVGEKLANVLPLDSNVTILSFQNGVRNAEILNKALIEHKNIHVASSMVNFNAYWELNTNLFHKTTDGGVQMELPKPNATTTASGSDDTNIHASRMEALAQALNDNHVPSKTVSNIQSIQYSKLLVNLFNAINALSGKSTPATLEQKGYRRVWGAAITEGLSVLSQNGIEVAPYRGMPPTLLKYTQILPDTLFWVVFRCMAKMDDSARSSMLQDLERGRTATEVEDLSGEIVRLGIETNTPTPVNVALVRLVHAAEAAGQGSPCLSAEDLLVQVGLEKA